MTKRNRGDLALYRHRGHLVAGYQDKFYLVDSVGNVGSGISRDEIEVFAGLIRGKRVTEYPAFDVAHSIKVKLFKNV